MKSGNYTAQKRSADSRRLALAAIGESGATREKIAEAVGYSKASMSRLFKSLRDDKLIYIGAWIPRTSEETGERAAGAAFAVYMLGDKKDVPRPPALAKGEVQAKWAKKNREQIRAMARKQAKRRARERAKERMRDNLVRAEKLNIAESTIARYREEFRRTGRTNMFAQLEAA